MSDRPRYTFERIDPETGNPLYRLDPHGECEMNDFGNIVPHPNFWAHVKAKLAEAGEKIGEGLGDAKFGGGE